MSARRLLALLALVGAGGALLGGAGLNANPVYEVDSGERSITVEVVSDGAAYMAYEPVRIRATALLDFTNKLGIRNWNNAAETMSFTWTETSDPGNRLGAASACNDVAAGGTLCEMRFSGTAPGAGTVVEVEGYVSATMSSARGAARSGAVIVEVEGCIC